MLVFQLLDLKIQSNLKTIQVKNSYLSLQKLQLKIRPDNLQKLAKIVRKPALFYRFM